MTIPRQWNPGEPLTASRFNDQIAESLISRRGISLGNGSSMVNESLGNQSANMRKQLLKLVVAKEDFIIQPDPTDLYNVTDDVPSGMVNLVRLNRGSGFHAEDDIEGEFRAWDPINGLFGQLCGSESNSSPTVTTSKSACDIFYVVYNEDSKRWEVLSAETSGQMRHATVCACSGDGWYVMELVDDLQTDPPDCDPNCDSASASASASVSASSSASDAINPCDLCTVDNLDAECGVAGSFDPMRTGAIGNGTFVYAYDKRAVPLKVGGQATIAWLGDMCSSSASASASASDDVAESRKLWTVLTGEYEMVAIPHEIWECCPIEGVKKVKCYTFLVEGVMCEGPDDPCESASSSASV